MSLSGQFLDMTLCVCLSGWHRIKRCYHVGGEADVPEESSSRRAPSGALAGLPGPEGTHPEDLSSPAQAPAGTVNLCFHISSEKPLSLASYTSFTTNMVFDRLRLIDWHCLRRIYSCRLCKSVVSSIRGFQPRPDLDSAVEGQPKISSKKQLLSQRQILPLKVTTITYPSVLILHS